MIDTDRTTGIECIPADAVHAELSRILKSRYFRSSRRSTQFLRYVVQQKLDGNERLIKERLIGIDVFGRKANYATGEDPVVRVQAGEVRRRLELYHAEAADALEISIDLPIGSYIPVFRKRPSRTEAAATQQEIATAPALPAPASETDSSQETVQRGPDVCLSEILPATSYKSVLPGASVHPSVGILQVEAAAPLSGAFRRRWLWLGMASILVLASVGACYHWYRNSGAGADAFTRFWGPVTNSPKPTVISLGRPFLYVPDARLFQQYTQDHPDAFSTGVERHNRYLPLPADTPLKWSDLHGVNNSGPAVGGVRAAMQLSSVLGRLCKPFVIRFGDEGSFLELRDSPAIVVGGLNNRWTSELDQDLHFGILDNTHYQYVRESGTNRVWRQAQTPHGWTDYGLITRQLSGPTGQFLVKVAGMSDAGTEAAGELVTDPDSLAMATASLPAHWERRNVQILVETEIIGGKAGPPRLVATYTW